jgi:CheY-like chemotaxis protein
MRTNPTTFRLLLIEDDDLTRELLVIQISAQGYHVEAVESGDAALRHLRQGPSPLPDAILTDLQMPGTSGPELAHQLRSHARNAGSPGTPLLAMSATAPSQDLAATYDGFLLKPFTMAQLEAALQPKLEPDLIERLSSTITGLPASDCLDEGVYQHLVAAIPATQLQQLYAMFLDDAEKRIARMRVAVGTGYDVTYRKEAHAIKGGCSMVGAGELHRLAAAAEEQGIDSANHVASLDELLMACGRLRRILVGHGIWAPS